MGTAASVGLAYAAVNTVAWREVGEAFTQFRAEAVLIALVPLVGAMLLRAARWWVLLRGEPVSLVQVAISQNAGIGLNNMLPVRVGSEAFQLALVTKHHNVPLPKALTSLAGGNVLDIFATGIFMVTGVVLIPTLRDTQVGILLFGAVVMVIVSFLVMVGVSRGLDSIPFASRIGFFHRVIESLKDLRHQPFNLFLSFLATFSHWALMGVAGWVLADGLGMDVGVVTMAAILVGATFFTSAMLSLPGGAGTYHFAVVSMLTAVGQSREVAFTFALVMHLLVFVPPMIVAFYAMSRLGTKALLRSGEEVKEQQAHVDQHEGVVGSEHAEVPEPVMEGSKSRS